MSDTSVWIPVGELADAFAPDANILETSSDLAGKTVDLHFEDGTIIEHRFVSGSELVWTIKAGASVGKTVTESYSCSVLRDGFYFVDFIKTQERAMSVSLVLDMGKSVFTAVIGQMPTKEEASKTLADRVAAGEELTAVGATFAHGTINTPFHADHPHHSATEELVGKRVFYKYSPTEEYEHIYLNANLYSWHCIIGVEAGLGDTERCHHYKIDENLYLFVWREKIIPTLGIIMIDLNRGKTTGKIMGYKGTDFAELSNFRVGAFARVLNVTNYANPL
jgi:MoaF C-terminal domain/MoaF N-terminal domain